MESKKQSHHSQELKIKLVNRMKRIEGQVRGIEKMIDTNVYCDDILNQITSVKSALDGVSKVLLEAHIKSCVVNQLENGEREVIDELLKTIRKMIK